MLSQFGSYIYKRQLVTVSSVSGVVFRVESHFDLVRKSFWTITIPSTVSLRCSQHHGFSWNENLFVLCFSDIRQRGSGPIATGKTSAKAFIIFWSSMVKRQIAKTERLGFDSSLEVRYFFVPHSWELNTDIFFLLTITSFHFITFL